MTSAPGPLTQSAVDQMRSAPEVILTSMARGPTSAVHMTEPVFTRVTRKVGREPPAKISSLPPWRLSTRSFSSHGSPGRLGRSEGAALGLGVGDGLAVPMASVRRPASSGSTAGVVGAAVLPLALGEDCALEVRSGPLPPLEHAHATTATTTSTATSTLIRRRQ
ncbi:hypothetical protein ACFQ0B_12980 [Nonomuraea thailandensis]